MLRNVRKIYVGIVTYRIYKTKKKECTCITLFVTGKTKKIKSENEEVFLSSISTNHVCQVRCPLSVRSHAILDTLP